MVKTLEAPETIGRDSKYLEHVEANQGLHLMIVSEAYEDQRPAGDALESINGFSLVCELVDGENAGKTYTLTLYDPKLSSKDGGAMSASKQAALLLATDLIDPSKLGKPVSYDIADAVGAFFVLDLILGNPSTSSGASNGKRYLEPKFSNIYHIDDPRAKAAIAKLDAKAKSRVAEIKPDYRHDAKYFESVVEKKQAKREPAPRADFSDL